MVIIVVGVGAIRGWRSTLLGTGAGLVVVAALILALGTALTYLPINGLRGRGWLAVVRVRPAVAPQGDPPGRRQRPPRHGREERTDDDVPAHGVDWIAFLLAFRGAVLEGLEVAIIVATFGAAARAFPSAAPRRGRRAGCHRRRRRAGPPARGAHPAQRPAAAGRHAAIRLRLLLGGMEGLGIAWPGADLFIISWPSGTSSPPPGTSGGCGGRPGMPASSLPSTRGEP